MVRFRVRARVGPSRERVRPVPPRLARSLDAGRRVFCCLFVVALRLVAASLLSSLQAHQLPPSSPPPLSPVTLLGVRESDRRRRKYHAGCGSFHIFADKLTTKQPTVEKSRKRTTTTTKKHPVVWHGGSRDSDRNRCCLIIISPFAPAAAKVFWVNRVISTGGYDNNIYHRCPKWCYSHRRRSSTGNFIDNWRAKCWKLGILNGFF